MIIINKTGYLIYKNLKFRCSLGKNSVGEKKFEGHKNDDVEKEEKEEEEQQQKNAYLMHLLCWQ